MNRDLAAQAMEVAGWLALRTFSDYPDRDDLVNDAKSMAWQMARGVPERATPSTIAEFAVRQVKVSRQFQWSVRTADHPRNRVSITRHSLDPLEHCHAGGDPARIAEVRIDLTEWLDQLSPRMYRMAAMFAAGYGTGEIARLYRLSPGRVSQLRQELREDWDEFHGEG